MAGRIYVCEVCIEDPALQEVVRKNACSTRCDYCNRESECEIACELSDVLDCIRYAIEQEYEDPLNVLTIVNGRFLGEVVSGLEIFWEIGFGLENDELISDLAHAFIDDSFCTRDYCEWTPSDVFGACWQRFTQVVQAKRRFTFWNSHEGGKYDDPAYGISAGNMLSTLASQMAHVSPVASLPEGTEIWRIRVHDRSISLTDSREFTSPPLERAKENRMSPAGVSMFYGAEDFETAYAETVEPNRKKSRLASGVKFSTLVPLNLLDLTADYRPISFFVDWDRSRRNAVAFLEEFANELSRPIERDDRQQIAYVPTQIFTEYVRFELKTENGEPFHGIKYRSSQNGKACFVIFADQDDCLPGSSDRVGRQLLGFVPGSLRTVEEL